MLHLLSTTPSIANRYVAELRDVNIQQDRMRFRRNMERIGECIGYELSKELHYDIKNITTPLGQAPTAMPMQRIVLATILIKFA